MIRQWFFPGLLDTGPVGDGLAAVRDGFVNLYVLRAPAGLVCIDSGWRPACVRRGFAALGLDPHDVAAVLLTHLHADHSRCLGLYADAAVLVGEREPAGVLAARLGRQRTAQRVQDGQTVAVAGLEVRVVHAPGHTPGTVAYVVDGRYLFTGDALRLDRGAVRPFPACFNRDPHAVRESLRKLAAIPGLERLLTAHTGTTTDLASAFRSWRTTAAAAAIVAGDAQP